MNNSPNTKPVVLRVMGLGHVPSFKNGKMLTRGRTITDPRKREWMDRCTRDFVSQLSCVLRTVADETQTELPARSLIAWLMPLDDSTRWVPELVVRAVQCAKGDEGAFVIVERI
jgi:hypothetical protein